MAKINASAKGKTGERECVKILNKKFGEKMFARAVSSGAWIGAGNRHRAQTLTEEQRLAFSSDLICPVNYKFVIEHKSYQDKATIWDFFNEKSVLNIWMKQVESDAEFVHKEPLLVIKYNNKKRIVFTKVKPKNFIFMFKDWYCLWFEDLLNNEDREYFFK